MTFTHVRFAVKAIAMKIVKTGNGRISQATVVLKEGQPLRHNRQCLSPQMDLGESESRTPQP